MSGSGSNDDTGAPRRGAVLPPPSDAPDDAPEAVQVPRMEPPPPSLEAMVQSRAEKPEPPTPWWVWAIVVVVAALVTGYVMR